MKHHTFFGRFIIVIIFLFEAFIVNSQSIFIVESDRLGEPNSIDVLLPEAINKANHGEDVTILFDAPGYVQMNSYLPTIECERGSITFDRSLDGKNPQIEQGIQFAADPDDPTAVYGLLLNTAPTASITIKNLNFNNFTNISGIYRTGIIINYGNNISILNCKFLNNHESIAIRNFANNIEIANNSFMHPGTGAASVCFNGLNYNTSLNKLNIHHNDFNLLNSQITDDIYYLNYDFGQPLVGTLNIENNTFKSATIAMFVSNSNQMGTDPFLELAINNNHFENSRKINLVLYNPLPYWEVDSNYFYSQNVNISVGSSFPSPNIYGLDFIAQNSIGETIHNGGNIFLDSTTQVAIEVSGSFGKGVKLIGFNLKSKLAVYGNYAHVRENRINLSNNENRPIIVYGNSGISAPSLTKAEINGNQLSVNYQLNGNQHTQSNADFAIDFYKSDENGSLLDYIGNQTISTITGETYTASLNLPQGTTLSFGDKIAATVTAYGNQLSPANPIGTSEVAYMNVTVPCHPVYARSNSPIKIGEEIRLYTTGGDSYNWSGPLGFMSNEQYPIIDSATKAMSGIYSVIVNNSNGCIDTASVIVKVDVLNVEFVEQKCTYAGSSDGSLLVNVTGGLPPYSYLWSNGSTDFEILGLRMGIYSITITDILNNQAVASFKIGADYKPNELYVKVRDNSQMKILYDSTKNSQFPNNPELNFLRNTGVYRIEQAFNSSDSIISKIYKVFFTGSPAFSENLINKFQQLPYIEYAERPTIYELSETNDIPNDPRYFEQWHLEKIKAADAWNTTNGNQNIIIAIIDNAFDINHEDLAGKIWENTAEVNGTDGVDNDGNGYIDDYNGWDFADNDNDVTPPNPVPAYNPNNTDPLWIMWHGTHCAGIAAANTNNGTGISSIGYNCKIMPLKIGKTEDASLNSADGDKAIKYAVDNGAKIISMSWGSTMPTNTTQKIINYAFSKNVICVGGAGNNLNGPNNGGFTPFYPASYNHVINVGSTNEYDEKSNFSNYHTTVDVMAPGSNILSCMPPIENQTGKYAFAEGTSMACPLVAGLCGLMLAADPTLEPGQVEACLKDGCEPLQSLSSNLVGNVGAGRINAFNSLSCLGTGAPPTALFDCVTISCYEHEFTFEDLSFAQPQITSWVWDYGDGTIESYSTPTNPTHTFPIMADPVDRDFYVKLTVTNPLGSNTYVKAVSLRNQTIKIAGSSDSKVCEGYPIYLTLDFDFHPPFSIDYDVMVNGVSNQYHIENINQTPYLLTLNPDTKEGDIVKFKILSFSDNYCSIKPVDYNASSFPSKIFNITKCCDKGKQNNNWVLNGNIGLDFNTPIPTVFDGTQIPFNSFSDPHLSSASISDNEGHLLFYTDGVTVWDNTNQIMNNGDGLNGSKYGYQTALILPDPNEANSNQYYIFNIKSGVDGGGGFWYSKVKKIINSDNYEIVAAQKNIPISTNDGTGAIIVSDRLTAIACENGKDFWVITHQYDGNKFLIYLLNQNGISLKNSVNIGMNEMRKVNGILKASPDGKYLAFFSFAIGAELYDFVNGNDLTPPTLIRRDQINYYAATSMDFSPNSKMLYFGLSGMPKMAQYNINEKIIDDFYIDGYGASCISLGPDGRIYLSHTPWTGDNGLLRLGVLNTPNATNADGTGFFSDGIVFENKKTAEALTNFAWMPPIKGVCEDVSNMCAKKINLTAYGGCDYYWNTGATTKTITVFPQVTTTYSVTITNSYGSEAHEVVVTVENPIFADAGADVNISNGVGVVLSASGGTQFNWTPALGLSNPTSQYPIASPNVTTIYALTVTNNAGCTATDEVIAFVDDYPEANAGEDINTCSGRSAVLNAVPCYQCSYSWSDNNSNTFTGISPTVNPQVTTTYTLTVNVGNTVIGTDDVIVYINSPIADAGVDKYKCKRFSVELSATPCESCTYSWNDENFIFDTREITVNPNITTTYTLTVTDANGCVGTDETVVNVLQAIANAGEDVYICQGEEVTLTAEYCEFCNYEWECSTEWNSNIFNQSVTVAPTSTTIYYLKTNVLNNQCSNYDMVTVFVKPSIPIANAGVDKTTCANSPTTLKASECCNCTYSWSDNFGNQFSTSEIIVTPPVKTTYTLTVTIDGSTINTDEVVVTTVAPIAYAGADKYFNCPNPEIRLDAYNDGSGFCTYQWNTENGIINGSGIYVSAIVTTAYTVSATDIRNGCTASDEVVVYIENNPPIADAGPDVTIPDGSTLLNATLCNQCNYLWYVPGEYLSVNPSYLVAPEITTTYYLRVTDVNGCSSSDAVVVVVSDLTVNAGEDMTICPGNGTNLNATSNGQFYEWSPNVGLNNRYLLNPIATPSITTTYTLVATNGDSYEVYDQVIVFVNPPPLAYAGADVQITTGSCTNLTASGGDTYTWSTGSTGNPLNVCPLVNSTYTVTVTDVNGCTASDEVVVFTEAQANITLINYESCPGLCDAAAIVNIVGGLPPFTYHWSNGSTIYNPINLCSGNNSVTITQGNGATLVQSIDIPHNPIIFNTPPDRYDIVSPASWVMENFTMAQTLHVYSELTLKKCTLIFAPDAEILVHEGGKLIIDDHTYLTGLAENNNPLACGSLWKGIVVLGTDAPQTAVAYPYEQPSPHGFVWLKNGSVIEKAENAIYAGKSVKYGTCSHCYTVTKGGIVWVDGDNLANEARTSFSNCRNGISFIYLETNVTASHILNADFINNQPLPNDLKYLQGPMEYISGGVNGLNIQKCNFEIAPNITTADYQMAIYGDGFFRNAQITSCNFKNLSYGVYGHFGKLDFSNNVFNNVKRGFFDKGGAKINVDNNQFLNIPQPEGIGGYSYQENFGAFFIGSKTFKLRNNTFIGKTGVNPLGLSGAAAYGVLCYQTGWDNPSCLLFKNNFSNCDYAIYTGGDNRSLDLRCNNLDNSEITSIAVFPVLDAIVLKDQGYGCVRNGDPAGNEWSSNCIYDPNDVIPNEIYIDNRIALPLGQPYWFKYYSYNETPTSAFTNPKCSPTLLMNNNECDFSKNSQSCYCENPNIPSTCGLLRISTTSNPIIVELNNLINEYNEEKASKEELLSNGDSQSLVNDISSNIAEGLLKNKLLAASPYLSDRVLIAAIKQKPTPMAVGIIKQLIDANSPLTPQVLYELEQRNPAIPPGIMKQINAAQTGVSIRFETEKNILWLQAELLKYRNMLAETYMTDGDLLTAKNLMTTSTSVYDKQSLTQIYLEEGNYTEARNALNLVLQNTATEQINQALNYVKVMNVVIDLAEDNKTLFEIDATQEQELRNVASSGTLAALKAESILELLYGERFPAMVSKINITQSRLVNNNATNSTKTEKFVFDKQNNLELDFVKLYPNPNNGNFIIEYNFSTNENINFEIYNILGDKIFSIALDNEQHLKNIENMALANGTYYYKVNAGSSVIKIDKFIVIK